MLRQHRARGLVALAALWALPAIASGCGSADAGTADNSTVAGTGGSSASGSGGTSGGGSGGTANGGGGTLGCQSDADCGVGQKCSVTSVCVPSDGCAADGDCDPGTFCSATQTCLADGTCAADADCDEGLVCDLATSACAPGGACGGGEFMTEAIAPNMLLVLDRSCSMTRKGGMPKTKWETAVDAINLLTMQFAGAIRWGLTLFPDTVQPKCEQGAAAVPVGDGNEAAIQGLLTAALAKADPNFPDGPCITNIDTAMLQASQEPAFLDKTRPSYAVLITDGKQYGCNVAGGDAGTTQLIQDMLASGVATFVVGFGGAVDPKQLNVFADAGGVPRADPATRFYQADDAATLQQALDQIAGSVVGCTFGLADTPPNVDDLFVFLDNGSVPRDPSHVEGWDYDPATNQITFYGSACDDLQSGAVTDVDVVFGCDQPTPT